ncbi:3-deoxy-7-phosphoheptulonate synthase [Nocardia arthritidis]|uniref:3-deoxy-7-phosphoheptulonate synthase n=1 Tax=Nocardia arthritidis TaxID=228602 RepID=UPI000A62E1C4|nr:3-deoxy-7-phosphoheptulonate synthase [Nocardia arthritidis]
MTITHTGPEPPGDCPPGGSGFRNHSEIRRFGHPLTRMLLASDGFTTPALSAILGTDLQVRVLRQDAVAAGLLPNTVTDALRVSGTDRVLVRHSCLVNADLVTASVNYVVAGRSSAAASGLDDVGMPIGSGLISRGLSQRRRLLRTGVTTWPDGRVCAARAYVMLLGDQPLCYIRESFNPDVIPPDFAATTGDDQPWADEPVLARAASSGIPRQLFPMHDLRGSERYAEESATPPNGARRSRPMPTLNHPDECDALTTSLAMAARGEGFVLHLGGRNGTSSGGETRAVADRRALTHAAAAIMAHVLGETSVTIERAPRRHPGNLRAAQGLGEWPDDRLPLTLCVSVLHQAADRCPDPVRRDLLRTVGGLLPIAAIAPPGAHELHNSIAPPCISREPTLPNPAASTRPGPDGRWWDRSAHLVWIGYPARERVRFAAGVGNPVAVALGPTTTPHDVERLCRALNPRRLPGRLTLAPRLGPARTLDTLPTLFAAAAACETPVCWVCDPMPTRRTKHGTATLRVDGALDGIHAFFRACRATGTVPGGLYLECEPVAVIDARSDRETGKLPADRRSRRVPGLDPVDILHCVIAALELRTS